MADLEVQYLQVQTTTDSRAEAMELSRAAGEARLAACAQVAGPVAPRYWWAGAVGRPGEVRVPCDVATGQQGNSPGQHAFGPLGDLLDGLAGMRGIARDHAVAPQVPAGPGFLDLRRGQTLVAAVVPFPQVGIGLRVGQAG